MRRVRFTVLAVLLCLETHATLLAQAAKPKTSPATPAPTRGGWRTAKWGMTPAQVLNALPGEVVVGEKGLAIEKLDVAGISMTAALLFRDDKLTQVKLLALEPQHRQFDTLSEALSKKYGPPATEKREPVKVSSIGSLVITAGSEEATWLVGDTAISLAFFKYKTQKDAGSGETVGITYSDRQAVSSNL